MNMFIHNAITIATRQNHTHKLRTLPASCTTHKHSFYVRAIPRWNSLTHEAGTGSTTRTFNGAAILIIQSLTNFGIYPGNRWDSASSMLANNATDTFDALLRKNIYGLIKRIFNINNDLIRVMYNCFEIVNGPMWISWANSLYTVNL